MGYLDSTGLAHLWQGVKAALSAKQDKLTGTPGQVVGFDESGKAVAQSAAGLGGGSSGGSTGEAYSTQEQVIGTWIDGKPLYRRVFQGEEITIAGWGNEYGISSAYTLSGGAIEGISKVVGLYGVFNYADAVQHAFPLMEYRQATEYALASLCYDSYGGVMVNTFAVGEIQYSGTCTAVMEYTKTTD